MKARRMASPTRIQRVGKWAACAVVIAILGEASAAEAHDSYDAPVIALTLGEGPRWGWGSPSAATLGNVGLLAGWRAEALRMGALGRVDWWNGSRGPVVDFGGFFSADFLSLWLEPQLSLATFVRFEAAARWESNAALWALAPSLVVGARAAGLEIGFAATWERWLSDLPAGSPKNGVVAEVRLGLDFVDFVHFVQDLTAGSTPLPP